ncbi:OLC1v1013738C2 [Oldenlandia corymbosa var. corymbosa]|uniref:OLC1v1013738C2 n=1 Tax=Oldenlandia corymbosa var. corymbosa TaxID=529605 RepID=A0AAV1E149_OLDCO|nr:OLC1v1013738C2 [Oldenlandia corymbosa var. corymbosa]
MRAAAPPPIILIATIFAAVSISSTAAFARSDTVPFILAHKKATLTKLHRPSDEQRVSVTIDIYNSGPIPAYDVSVVDDTWPSEIFDLITGNTSNSWKTLESGSYVSHSFELVPKWRTVYLGAPAFIKFRVPLKSKFQEAYSTPTLAIHTLADEVKTDKLQLVNSYEHVLMLLS